MNPLKPSMMLSFQLDNVKETHSARIFTFYHTCISQVNKWKLENKRVSRSGC